MAGLPLKVSLEELDLEEFGKIRDEYNNNWETRIVLVGKTGAGKSSTGNTILGKKAFKARKASGSVTTECTSSVAEREDGFMKVIDVPGFIDMEITQEEEERAITQCVIEASPGIHAILMVMRIGRFTNDEQQTLDRFIKWFGADARKFVIAVFTGLDDLDEDQTFDDYIAEATGPLTTFLTSIGNRYIAVDNKSNNNAEWVMILLSKIKELQINNNGQCYTNDELQKASNEVKKVDEEKQRQKKIEQEQEKNGILKDAEKKHSAEMNQILQEMSQLEKKLLMAEMSKHTNNTKGQMAKIVSACSIIGMSTGVWSLIGLSGGPIGAAIGAGAGAVMGLIMVIGGTFATKYIEKTIADEKKEN